MLKKSDAFIKLRKTRGRFATCWHDAGIVDVTGLFPTLILTCSCATLTQINVAGIIPSISSLSSSALRWNRHTAGMR